MLYRSNLATSRAKERKTKTQEQRKVANLFVATFFGVFAPVFVLSAIIGVAEGGIHLGANSDSAYYLAAKEDSG